MGHTVSPEKILAFEELPATLRDACSEDFPNEKPTICAFAPGRVNLIGEHVDYNDGFVLPMATPVGTMIIGKELDDPANNKCYIRTLSSKYDLFNS